MILGLSFSHNATACLVEERRGAVVFCASEERFTRRKNEWGIPYRALDYLFRKYARPEEISAVAVGESYRLQYGSAEYAALLNLVSYDVKDAYIRSKVRLLRVVAKEAVARLGHRALPLQALVTVRLKRLGLHAPVRFFDHHTAHAASAYYGSPFDEATVITLDGEGDGISGSCWEGRGESLRCIETFPEEASLGLFYKSITSLLGFKVNQQEGKVTGLAAQGDPARFRGILGRYLSAEAQNGCLAISSKAACRHMARLSRRRVFFLRVLAYMPMIVRASEWEPLFNEMLRAEFRDLYAELSPPDSGVPAASAGTLAWAADVAAAAQQVFEDVAVTVVRYCLRKTPSRNLALAGGVFANVQLNKRLLELPEAPRLYVHPGIGDEGLAFGAAYRVRAAIYSAVNSGNAAGGPISLIGPRPLGPHGPIREIGPTTVLSSVFVGASYDDEDILRALASADVNHEVLTEDQLVARAVEALCAGRVVGLFRGASEYGPRALGHRSILANPAAPELSSRLNTRLRRSSFMPFAPTVLAECFETIFCNANLAGAGGVAPFMTIALEVAPAWRSRIPAVVHSDGTARPQRLAAADEPFFHRLLSAFHEATGVGCLLNTSMNLHEEPLANSPEDALGVLARGGVDDLILGSRWVTR